MSSRSSALRLLPTSLRPNPLSKRVVVAAGILALLCASSVSAPVRAQESDEAASPTASVTISPTEGFVVESGDRESRFELHYSTWIRFETHVVADVDTVPRFTLPLARVILQASFFNGRLATFLQPEFAGSRGPRLLDASIDFRASDHAIFRAGQFRTPMSRAFIGPILVLQLPDRGFVSDTFRLGRDTGLMLFGHGLARRLEYAVGVFSGANINTLDGDTVAPMAVARLAYNVGEIIPADQAPAAQGPRDFGLTFGIAAAYRQRSIVIDEMMDTRADQESIHAAADLTLMAGPVSATAEGFIRSTRLDRGDFELGWGAFVQAGVFVVPRIFEIAARAGFMDDETGSGKRQTYEAGISLYAPYRDTGLGHHLKLQAAYAYDRAEADFGGNGDDRHRFTLQLQLWM